jgi:hypothetical protein
MIRCKVVVSIMACDQGTYREGDFLDVSDSVMAMFEREHVAVAVQSKTELPKLEPKPAQNLVGKGKGGKK